MILGTDFFSLPASDLKRAVAFYRDRMGLTPTSAWGEMGQEFDIGPLTMALLHSASIGQTFRPAKTFTVAWGVSDIEAAVADLKAHGVQFPGETFTTKVCQMAFCEDSEGNAMMLHRRHDAPPAETGGKPFVVTGIDFIGLPVQDLAGARRFYEETLGFEKTNENVWPEYDLGEMTLNLFEPEKIDMAFAPADSSIVAMRVADVPASMETLKQAGITFDAAMIDSGVCHMVPFSDPAGNTLMIHHRYVPEG